METEKQIKDGRCIVGIKGRLNAVTASDLEQSLNQTIEEGSLQIVLDLASLEYISSAGLRIFLVIAKRLKTLKGELCLAGLEGNIKEVIEISGFPAIMPCYDSIADLPAS